MVELEAQRILCKIVRNGGGYASKWAIKGGLQGALDLITVWQGRTYFIEAKLIKMDRYGKWNKKYGVVTHGQITEIQNIAKAGGRAGVLLLVYNPKIPATLECHYTPASKLMGVSSRCRVAQDPGSEHILKYGVKANEKFEAESLFEYLEWANEDS